MTPPQPSFFLPGLELCRLLYVEAVRPLLDGAYPDLPHTAARIGGGSEVLGFDTERSADHDWGPRLQLFLRGDDVERHAAALRRLLSERLPKEIRGWSTNFGPPDGGVRVMAATAGPVDHRIEIDGTRPWLTGCLGFDPSQGVGLLDWLATPSQRLAEVTAGAVYHDGLGELSAVRAALDWYPDDVWRYLLACQWQRVAQEEAFVGRCAEAGDDLGSRVVAARLVRELMRLCLLLARRHAPYSKWLGSAFGRLEGIEPVAVLLRSALATESAEERQRAVAGAGSLVGEWQNRLALAEAVDPSVRGFHARPFPVVDAGRFADALAEAVTDPEVRALQRFGSVDQFADSTDALGDPAWCRAAVRDARIVG